MFRPTAIVSALFLTACAHGAAVPCDRSSAVEILGSGGPIPDDDRASAGYLVWRDGRARVLVDAGGGTFQRFAASGADFADLQALALTHFHADHSSDVPALMKAGFFSSRRESLPVIGPTGRGPFPGLTDWTTALFGPDEGAFAYLSWILAPEEGSFSVDLMEVDADSRTPTKVVQSPDLTVAAVGVEHGPVPALAYRVEIGGAVVVFSGDQNANNPQFVELARRADVLVMHHAVPEDATGVAANLHAPPSHIGEVAARAGVNHLVLSHHMQRALDDLAGGLNRIRERYGGQITIGEDGACVPL